LEVTKKDLIPKSTPIVVSSFIGAFIGVSWLVSTNIEAKYFPVGVTLIVALLIVPLIGLCKTISIPSLNLGIINKSFSTITFCGTEKDCLPLCFDLNFSSNLKGKLLPVLGIRNFLKNRSVFTQNCTVLRIKTFFLTIIIKTFVGANKN
jgi:hypothetical protein